jgi:hypothetical protein
MAACDLAAFWKIVSSGEIYKVLKPPSIDHKQRRAEYQVCCEDTDVRTHRRSLLIERCLQLVHSRTDKGKVVAGLVAAMGTAT